MATQKAQVASPRTRITAAGDDRSVKRGRVIVSGEVHVHEGRGARTAGLGLVTGGAVVAGAVDGGGLVGFAEVEEAVSGSFAGCEVEHAAATETSNATTEVTPHVRTE